MDKADVDDLLSRLTEIDQLMEFPSVSGHVERVERLAMSIVRAAPSGKVIQLAMRVIDEVNALRASPLPLKPRRARLDVVLAELRRAIVAALDSP